MKNSFRSISTELFTLHDEIRYKWPCITRVAIALFDEDTGLLHTFLQATDPQKIIQHYSFLLSESNSLSEIAKTRKPRYIADLSVLDKEQTKHSCFVNQNFKSSYTFPAYWNDQMLGFIFYDAEEKDYFNDELVKDLTTYSKVIEGLIQAEIMPLKMLVSMFNVTHQVAHTRDSETSKHMLRVAHYMELLAIELADHFNFTDEEIEYVWLYAPMHDLGKIVMPDNVLQKQSSLTDSEREIINSHVTEGLSIIKKVLDQFSFKSLYHLNLLLDIIGTHHERWNGSGYPKGLQKEDIPPIGRIAAVADVFDALSNKRVYREAVPIDKVFQYIEEHKGVLFDPVVVDAFLSKKNEVLKIHTQLQEDELIER